MKKKHVLALATLLAATAGLAQNQPVPAARPQPALCNHCGVVQSVHPEKRKGEGGAAGLVGGAVVGGLLGHQVGGGSGKTLATVGGAAAGAYVGNEVQKNANRRTVWVTKVRMKDGSTRQFEQASRPAWKSGQVVAANGHTLALR